MFFGLMMGVLIAAPMAHAKSSATVKKLMKHPISVLSFGLYLYDAHLAEAMSDDTFLKGLPGVSSLATTVHYNNEQDGMEIRGIAFPKAAGSAPIDGKAVCKGVIGKLRAFSGIDPKTGQPNHGASSHFSAYFSGEVWGGKKLTDEDRTQVDKATTVAAVVRYDDDRATRREVSCHGPLRDSTVAFE